MTPWLSLVSAKAQVVPEPAVRQRIEAAIPTQPVVPPRQPRKLLIFDLNVGYGGHPSIATANLAFTLMGQKTGAFDTVVSRDPSVFKPESLRQFAAVFLNNTVGNIFEDPALRQSLVEFIYRGGGLMGVHGTTVAFTQWPGAIEDWPEFGLMLAARGANHRDSDEHVFIKLDDPEHPLNQPFGGQGFEYRDEFFRVHGPYSRHRVRVLFGIDTEKTDIKGAARGDCFREDNDYALAWVRQYGRGRVFYCTIAHNPYVFWDPKMLRFYLAAAQFALGDLPAPTTPSSRLTVPAVRAQEKLGWRLGLPANIFPQNTLLEVINQAAELGLGYVGAADTQLLSPRLGIGFNEKLSADSRKEVRVMLDAAGVRLVTYQITQAPTDASDWRRKFEFARNMGVETIIAEPPSDALEAMDVLCNEYELNLALQHQKRESARLYDRPEEVLKVCEGRSRRIGACGDLGSWMRLGIAAVEALRMLGDRMFLLQVHDFNELTTRGRDVPWGTGAGKLSQVLEEVGRLGIKPTMFGIAYQTSGSNLRSEIAESIRFFNKLSVQLAK